MTINKDEAAQNKVIDLKYLLHLNKVKINFYYIFRD